jgi:hypothetical protein
VFLKVGDKLACVYTASGSIEFRQNGQKVMGFDTGRPIQEDTDYYAVLDVSFSAACLTVLKSEDNTVTVGSLEELSTSDGELESESSDSETDRLSALGDDDNDEK